MKIISLFTVIFYLFCVGYAVERIQFREMPEDWPAFSPNHLDKRSVSDNYCNKAQCDSNDNPPCGLGMCCDSVEVGEAGQGIKRCYDRNAGPVILSALNQECNIGDPCYGCLQQRECKIDPPGPFGTYLCLNPTFKKDLGCTCASHSECGSGEYCLQDEQGAMVCGVQGLGLNAKCAEDTQCFSDNCVGGFCAANIQNVDDVATCSNNDPWISGIQSSGSDSNLYPCCCLQCVPAKFPAICPYGSSCQLTLTYWQNAPGGWCNYWKDTDVRCNSHSDCGDYRDCFPKEGQQINITYCKPIYEAGEGEWCPSTSKNEYKRYCARGMVCDPIDSKCRISNVGDPCDEFSCATPFQRCVCNPNTKTPQCVDYLGLCPTQFEALKTCALANDCPTTGPPGIGWDASQQYPNERECISRMCANELADFYCCSYCDAGRLPPADFHLDCATKQRVQPTCCDFDTALNTPSCAAPSQCPPGFVEKIDFTRATIAPPTTGATSPLTTTTGATTGNPTMATTTGTGTTQQQQTTSQPQNTAATTEKITKTVSQTEIVTEVITESATAVVTDGSGGTKVGTVEKTKTGTKVATKEKVVTDVGTFYSSANCLRTNFLISLFSTVFVVFYFW